MTEAELCMKLKDLDLTDLAPFVLRYSLYITKTNDMIKAEKVGSQFNLWVTYCVLSILRDHFFCKSQSSRARVTTRTSILGHPQNIAMIIKILEKILSYVSDTVYKIWTDNNVIEITSKNNKSIKLKPGEEEWETVIP